MSNNVDDKGHSAIMKNKTGWKCSSVRGDKKYA